MEQQKYNNTHPYSSQQFSHRYTQSESASMPPKSWMTESILVTIVSLCCCLLSLPFGIVAMVNANKVNVFYFRGQYTEAKQASKDAKLWVMIALGTVVLGIILLIGFIYSMIMLGSGDFTSIFESVRNSGATEW
jgi:hypothetical protein